MTSPDKPTIAVIKLAFQTDIVAAIESLRFNEAQKIYFVLPNQPCAFKNHFNLNLLKQTSGILKKEFVLVSPDPVIADLAQKLNIQFEARIDEAALFQPESVPEEPKVEPVVEEPPEPTPEESLGGRLAEITGRKIVKKDVVQPQKDSQDLVIKKPVIQTEVKQDVRDDPSQAKGVSETKSKAKPPLFATDATSAKAGPRIKTWLLLLVPVLIFLCLLTVYYFWPKTAVINIETDVTIVKLPDYQVNLRQGQNFVDVNGSSAPLQMFPLDRRLEKVVPAKGQADGVRASGVIEISNCSTTTPLVINSATVFQKDEKNFRLQARDLEVQIAVATDAASCQATTGASNKLSLRIEAAAVGEEYNLSEGSYQIVGVAEDNYNVAGFAIEGGQDGASCILEEDLETSAADFGSLRRDEQAKVELRRKIESQPNDLIVLPDVFQMAVDEVVQPDLCPSVVDNKITQIIVYYMGAVKKSDLEKVIEPQLEEIADGLTILDNGLETADYQAYREYDARVDIKPNIQEAAPWGYYVLVNITDANASTVLNEEEVLKAVVGQQARKVGSNLRRYKGVKDVEIQLHPWWAFWLTEIPQNPDDITIQIEMPTSDN